MESAVQSDAAESTELFHVFDNLSICSASMNNSRSLAADLVSCTSVAKTTAGRDIIAASVCVPLSCFIYVRLQFCNSDQYHARYSVVKH